MKRYLLYLLYFWICVGCQEERTVEPAFYHWKSSWQVDETEQNYLEQLKVQKIYVRLFDVVWDGSLADAKPVGKFSTSTILPSNFEIIPTIYITNATMLKIKPNQLPILVDRIHQKLETIFDKLGLKNIQEIQFDCDWSLKSKERYFEFLKRFQDRVASKNTQLSTTIRLHQIKFYKKTGVPPVQKGMLMFYNMGDVQNMNTPNSILDLDIAEKYMYNFEEYPLTLDIALPLFSWGVVFRRNKTVDLINDLHTTEMNDTTKYLRLEDNRIKIKESHYFKRRYLYKNDFIRIENISKQQLLESAEMLKTELQNPNLLVTFYHIDTSVLSNYSVRDLVEICEAFNM